jgi:hypothetical protein
LHGEGRPRSRSASSSTISESLLPNCNATRQKAARTAMDLTIATPPKKVTDSAKGCVIDLSKISRGSPVNTYNIGAGKPVSYSTSGR